MKGSVLDVIAERLLGDRAGDVMGIVSIISIAASISAMTFAGPRVTTRWRATACFYRAAAEVIVADNGSTDGSQAIAAREGARSSPSPSAATAPP